MGVRLPLRVPEVKELVLNKLFRVKFLNIIILIFIVLTAVYIIFFSFTFEKYGTEFINQVRSSDSDNTLISFDDSELIEIGKELCVESKNWKDENASLININSILSTKISTIDIGNRILPILRFQSIYELCPENISNLENLFKSSE